MSLKKKLNTETLEPKLKAYYNLSEVQKILHIKREASLKDRIGFLFDVRYKLPKDLALIKRGIKKFTGRYYIKYTYICRIEQLIELLRTKYTGAFTDYLLARNCYSNSYIYNLRDNANKDFIYTMIKQGKRLRGMRTTRKKPLKKFMKTLIKRKRKSLLNKIYKEEHLC